MRHKLMKRPSEPAESAFSAFNPPKDQGGPRSHGGPADSGGMTHHTSDQSHWERSFVLGASWEGKVNIEIHIFIHMPTIVFLANIPTLPAVGIFFISKFIELTCLLSIYN